MQATTTELIKSKPLGSAERLALIVKYGNKKASNAAFRCLQKRKRRSYLIEVCKMPSNIAFKIVQEEWIRENIITKLKSK